MLINLWGQFWEKGFTALCVRVFSQKLDDGVHWHVPNRA